MTVLVETDNKFGKLIYMFTFKSAFIFTVSIIVLKLFGSDLRKTGQNRILLSFQADPVV